MDKLSNEEILNACRPFNSEVSATLPEFDTSTNDLCVAHIDRVLFGVAADPDFKRLDAHDQNLLLWVSLLHDISKVMDKIGMKDPFHPFRSAARTIQCICEWGWAERPETGEALRQSILRSFVIIWETEVPDTEQLPTLARGLLTLAGLPDGDNPAAEMRRVADKSRLFPLELVLLVMLHQSLTLLTQYKPLTALPDAAIPLYFTNRLLRLMRILARRDSAAYNFENVRSLAESFQTQIAERMDFYESLVPD